MRALVDYVMRGRREAITVVLICALLPLLSWLGSVFMALVTLRKGAKEGFILLAWLLLPTFALAIVMKHLGWMFGNQLIGSILIWLFAVVLQRTNSWLLVMQLGTVLGLFAVVGAHLFDPELAVNGLKSLSSFWQTINGEAGLPAENIQPTLQVLAVIITGVLVAVVTLNALLNLVLARWIQTLKYNPGELHKELHFLRLDLVSMLGVVLIATAAFFLGIPVAVDMLPVVCLPLLLCGLSLAHFFAARVQRGTVWLVLLYVGFIVQFPLFLGITVCMASVDSVLNFRARKLKEV